ncbi:adenylosuccinate lyase [Metarhizium brunneum]
MAWKPSLLTTNTLANAERHGSMSTPLEPLPLLPRLFSIWLITVGKRAAQWVLVLMLDPHAVEQVRQGIESRCPQGTKDSASFVSIFEYDTLKYNQLNELLWKKFGLRSCYDIFTQTYTCKVDLIIANAVAGLRFTAQKITEDIRLYSLARESMSNSSKHITTDLLN